jgi:lipid-binding SYLF domain-containing protein
VAALAMLASAWAENKETERVEAATTVINEIMSTPDKGIPGEVLGSAKCVAVVPSMKKAGFVVGGNYGKGIAVCHNASGWSAPAPFTIEGGSWGLQIGGQAIDLVMLVMNDQGMENLLNSKFKLGADASAAAGPVGRQAEASTDWKLKAQVLTYSRAKGAFAGVSLNGAVVKQDSDGTKELYGKDIPFRTILTGGVPTPSEAQPFVAAVQKYTSESPSQATNAPASSAPASQPAESTSQSSTGAVSQPGTTQSQATNAQTTNAPATQPAENANQSAAGAASQSSTGALPQSSQVGNTATAAQIQAQILEKLKAEPGISASDVNVNVSDDAIELSGSVPTQNDKAAARRIAESYAGSRHVVDDKLVVK